MIPNNLSLLVTDVLNYHQKKERVFVTARTFSAITLRLKTPGKYTCNGKTIGFEPGSVCIIPAGVAYERNNLEEDILVIHFHMMNYAMEEIQVFQVADAEKYKRLFEKALNLKYDNEVGSIYRITAVVYEILAELTRDTGLGADPKDNRILEILEYIQQNFWNPQLSVEQLARQACVSPAYLRREFHRLCGTSPKKYLDTLRIQYAISLLETAYFSQKEISDQCGFSDVGYFRTVFKRKMGRSITQYLSDTTRNAY